MAKSTIFNQNENDTLFFVAIEWDGEQPPSTWYERMHYLAGRVRGDKDETPVVRRDNDSGVIFQEGLILTPSESLARTLAFLARDKFEAAAVAVGEAVINPAFTMSREDAAIINRISRTLGKRGRKPKPQDWVVTCIEEMTTYGVNESQPIQCPHCRGMRIRVRPGTRTGYRDDHDDILALWIRTRFAGPHWEPAGVDMLTDIDPVPPAIDDIEFGSDLDSEFVAGLQNSGIAEQIEHLPRFKQLELLDAVYVARRFTNSAKRQTARINAVAKYFQYGGTRSDFAIAETPIPDLLDTAAVMGDERAARLWRGVMDGKTGGNAA